MFNSFQNTLMDSALDDILSNTLGGSSRTRPPGMGTIFRWAFMKAFMGQDTGKSENPVEIKLFDLKNQTVQRYSCHDLQRFTSNFAKENEIGAGAYGRVYKGYITDRSNPVAVKVIYEKDVSPTVVEETFISEVSTLWNTHHQNLVKLYGYCFSDDMKALVFEYMENGSFDKVLFEDHLSLEWDKLYAIAIGIANGLAYLHESCTQQIVHHDVKPENVFLGSDLSPKVGDFGLARLMNRDESHFTLTHIRGTRGYMAPETWIASAEVTYKCDTYSFGMMLFEILGRKKNMMEGEMWFPRKVWNHCKSMQLDELFAEYGIKETDVEKATVLAKVALWCVQFAPARRPYMSEVVKMLKDVSVRMPPDPEFLS